jgi:anthraniloyl-CoA monooxygenase
VHLGARALGGAALVMVEMTSPTARGPHHARLPRPVERRAAAALQAHRRLRARPERPQKSACNSATAGPRARPSVGWEGNDEPLPDAGGNWPLLAASAVPYGAQNQTPRAMTRADMDLLMREAVCRATRRAAAAGFDWLELHCAHGYLLSSFISPLTNRRTDDYGGSEGLENRCRYPLEVFPPCAPSGRRQPDERAHLRARLGAGRQHADDAVQIARLFKAAGCDLIDVSSGQTTREAKPVYGRMYQTPFADRIRNEAGHPTIAVGAITQADQANSIIAAGRADLCAVARPHLADPAWTLHEAGGAAAAPCRLAAPVSERARPAVPRGGASCSRPRELPPWPRPMPRPGRRDSEHGQGSAPRRHRLRGNIRRKNCACGCAC